jgi:hypothetical protein
MPTKKDHTWLIQRLERRAKDARQAQGDATRLWLTAYPDAQYLAKIHGEAAEVYARAIVAITTLDVEPTDI